MKIAVMSDSHDNIWSLEKALQKAQGADALVFCGDLCAPFSLKMLAAGFNGPIHVMRGNNDGDVTLLLRVAGQNGHVRFHTEALAEIELGGRKIAIAHYAHLAQAVAPSGRYDAVFFGHTHQRIKRWEGSTLVLNPGEVMGRFGTHTSALYDTDIHDAEFVEF
jgi:putative phosphoesterase